MKILITGATGFIGRNLCEELEKSDKNYELYRVNSKTGEDELFDYLKQCDFLYNLAAVHRPSNPDDFKIINIDYFSKILSTLKNENPSCKVMTMSSIQVSNGSLYGCSKAAAERLLEDYGTDTGSPVHIVRLTNCFGKYARPNAHSVVATFCYNISHDLPIKIDNPDSIIRLCYIDDVINLLISFLSLRKSSLSYVEDKLVYPVTVGYLAKSLMKLKSGFLPENDVFLEKLKITFDWYSQL